jgi:ribosomal protein S18 acetylase RimI-like enzyme
MIRDRWFMFKIRPMRREDIAFAIRLSNQEKWGISRADFERLLTLAPRGCFLAFSGRRKLGLTTTTSYGREAAWIGNVVVEKSYRGKHIGASLVEQAVGYLLKSGVKRIVLYCFDENVVFYRNLGFEKDVRFARLRRKKHTSSPTSAIIKRLHPPPITRILSADKKAFGADRSKLIRLLLRERIGWYVGATHDSASVSYLFVKQYEDMCEFGPWVCIKPQKGDPRRLLDVALSEAGERPIEITCLLGHRNELALLKRNGFRITNRGYRMRLGKRHTVGDDRAQCALGFLDKG